jgi:hypothetical protein
MRDKKIETGECYERQGKIEESQETIEVNIDSAHK